MAASWPNHTCDEGPFAYQLTPLEHNNLHRSTIGLGPHDPHTPIAYDEKPGACLAVPHQSLPILQHY